MPEEVTLDDLRAQSEQSVEVTTETAEETGVTETEEVENGSPVHTETAEFDLSLEDDEPASEQQVPKSVHIHKLKKLKTRAKEAEGELEQLKAEVERLKQGNPQQAAPQPAAKMPTLADCDYDEDKHAQAMANYLQEQAQGSAQKFYESQQQQQMQQRQQQAMAEKVDEHIGRADAFIRENEKAGLTADMYVSAESAVRNALDPQGAGVVDQIVAHMGQGSERVMYYLGRNPGKLMDVQRLLQSDPTGISALLKLGELKTQLNARQQQSKISKAPKPDEGLSGDVQTTTDSGLKKKFDKAVKDGDVQSMVSIRKQAREQGLNLE